MTDVVTPQKRSEMMSAIKGQNTRPEMAIRKGLHAMGLRYRLHEKNVPGKPDIILQKYKAVIFIHGCFWHQHDCHLFKWPQTRTDFWRTKIEGNKQRDLQTLLRLQAEGWRVLTVWECALKGKTRLDLEKVLSTIVSWLQSGRELEEIKGKHLAK